MLDTKVPAMCEVKRLGRLSKGGKDVHSITSYDLFSNKH